VSSRGCAPNSEEPVVNVSLICELFGLGTPIGQPRYVARGEIGRVSRLTTKAGTWAVKEIDHFVPTVDEADANADLQELMLDAGVSLPRPRRTVDGHALFGNVRVYEWLDITPIAVGDREAEAMVAASLARMHRSAPCTDGSPDPWYCESVTRDGWDEVLNEGAGSWWVPVIAGLLAELAELPRPVHSPTRVCHLDVCPENVFVANGRLTVTDWENAGPAATIQDLGSKLWDFCQGDVDRTCAFVNYYRRQGGPIERLDESVFDTARVVQANLLAFHCRRALDTTGPPETYERAEGAVRAMLARPLTARFVEEMVATPS
jgi:Ser/Thr protein kinase RdoA (MazF antagonist)